ncbi:Uma2 family endonuclease [Nocardiopsis sp. HUAS JQ3]|uniref:Uma2 family endonuclease n=1 Tax=Nocardiopsis sp. HUAS JQ3 TaxID=3061629 RepID=UPI0023A9B8B8|nr:Uma2 family endonuclease [Nocardiopsis sp. HUAS JQ3]WDZ91896.1 Uma2 family endonuclease [Nocardiopsis sp. HUAS JQ3]
MDLPTLADSLELPEGFRAEIISGSIIVSPTPTYWHAEIVAVLHELLLEKGLHELRALQTVTVLIPGMEERYVPDLVVFSKEALKQGDRKSWKRSPEGAELAVEVVSPSSTFHDWRTKAVGYARAGVPLYLVVDPTKEKVALYSAPEDGQYQQETKVTGEGTVRLPEPFDMEIRASQLFELN